MRSFKTLSIAAALVLALAAMGAAAKAKTADLAISNADNPDPVAVGTTLTYSIGVQNLGPDSVNRATVSDQLPKGVDFVSATPSAGKCVRKGRNVTCELGPVAAAAVSYSPPPAVTLVVIPRQAGVISDTATVKGDLKDPVAAKQSDRDDHRPRAAGAMSRRCRHDHWHGRRRRHRWHAGSRRDRHLRRQRHDRLAGWP